MGGGGVGKDRLQGGYEWGGGREPRRIGSRKDMSGGGGVGSQEG